MTLYQLNEQIENFEFQIDDETGEILNLHELDNLKLSKDEKVENIALWIKNLKAETDALKQEETNLKKRREVKSRKIDNLSAYLKNALEGSKFESSKVAISYRKSTKVEVDDDFIAYAKSNKLYDLYTESVSYKPSLKDIKNYIKEGNELEHCQLIEKNNIQIK